MKPSFSPPRRTFLKTVAFGSAYSVLVGRSWSDLFAAEVQAPAATTTGTLRITLSQFPALLSESGSVRLLINPLTGGPPTGPRPIGSFYPVILNRGPNNTFYALSSRCTHQNCTVDPMDPFTNEMTCPCHGSVFAIDGRRLRGLASSRLTAYTARFDGHDTLAVQIPNLGFSLAASRVAGGATENPRLRLDFRSQRNVDYEVHFREALDKAPAPVAFATTADGALDQTVFTATSATSVSLFVERAAPAGFYQIGVRATEG
jgi:Rieske Fe-S protein